MTRPARPLLTPRGLVVLLAAIGTIYLVAGLARYFAGNGVLTFSGAPLAPDFLQYYVASQFTLAGHPADAYRPDLLFARMHEIVGPVIPNGYFAYLPSYLLLVAPLSLLPFLAALALWTALGLAVFGGAVARLPRGPLAPFLFLLFPVVAQTVFAGQNALLFAGVLGWALLLVDRRQLVAGCLIGLLTLKPHLGAAVAVAVVAGGYWRAATAAAVTAAALALASVAVLGVAPWLAFGASFGDVAAGVEAGQWDWFRMRSVFAAARMLGASPAWSWAAQGFATVAVLAVVAVTWRRGVPLALRAATLLAAVPLAAPYVQYYDLALLALLFPWWVETASASGWRAGERAFLAALWLAPIWHDVLMHYLGVQFWPLLLAIALALLWRRCRLNGAAVS